MTLAYMVIFLSFALFSASVVIMLAWALRAGQFENFRQGALSIFDPDEPVGQMTDSFPEEKPKGSQQKSVSEEGQS